MFGVKGEVYYESNLEPYKGHYDLDGMTEVEIEKFVFNTMPNTCPLIKKVVLNDIDYFETFEISPSDPEQDYAYVFAVMQGHDRIADILQRQVSTGGIITGFLHAARRNDLNRMYSIQTFLHAQLPLSGKSIEFSMPEAYKLLVLSNIAPETMKIACEMGCQVCEHALNNAALLSTPKMFDTLMNYFDKEERQLPFWFERNTKPFTPERLLTEHAPIANAYLAAKHASRYEMARHITNAYFTDDTWLALSLMRNIIASSREDHLSAERLQIYNRLSQFDSSESGLPSLLHH